MIIGRPDILNLHVSSFHLHAKILHYARVSKAVVIPHTTVISYKPKFIIIYSSIVAECITNVLIILRISQQGIFFVKLPMLAQVVREQV